MTDQFNVSGAGTNGDHQVVNDEQKVRNSRINQHKLQVGWEETGRKSFRPSEEMCIAFKHVELTFDARDYEQPYRYVKIFFPPGFTALTGASEAIVFFGGCRESRTNRWMDRALILYCYVQKLKAHLYLAEDFGLPRPDKPDASTLEDRIYPQEGFSAFINMPEDYIEPIVQMVYRVVFNCMISATAFPTHLVKPVAPSDWPRKKRRDWVAEAPEYIEFIDQDIRWYDRGTSTGQQAAPEGHHRSPKPHWRRGHWRWQAHGEGRSQRKRIFIRPVLINATYFTGDHTQDLTEYEAK